jgi:hypothetical protein
VAPDCDGCKVLLLRRRQPSAAVPATLGLDARSCRVTSSPNNETEFARGAMDARFPAPLILQAEFGLWLAVLRLDGQDHCYGLFGDRADAERLLSVALVRLEPPL